MRSGAGMLQRNCTCVYVADAQANSILDRPFHLTSLQTTSASSFPACAQEGVDQKVWGRLQIRLLHKG